MKRGERPAVPVYFGPEGARLFGWFHPPSGSVTGPVVVICPAVGFPMIMSHRGLRHLAESSAASGMPTLRFDYHGTGDSAGSDHEAGRVDAWISSIGHAVEEAKRLTGAREVALVGLRLGTLLASCAAMVRDDIVALVAWAPVTSGKARVRELHASGQLASSRDPAPGDEDEPLVAQGFVFTRDTIERLGELDAECLHRAPASQVLVVPRDDLPDDERFARVMEGMGANVTVSHLAGFEGMMRDPHLAEVPSEAIRGMVEWLRRIPPTTSRVVTPSGTHVLHEASSAVREQPFFAHGGRLFGVLTRPAAGGGPGRPAIILANAGAVHHIGPNRLHVTMARVWAKLGFPVLRLDLGGLGDSPPAPGSSENETYSARAVADIGEAVEALGSSREVKANGVVVAGLCAGAHAAFHAALQLQGIVGVLLVNPIVLYWTPDASLDVSPWMTRHRVKWYRRSAMRLASWGKLLRGQVDVASAAQTLVMWVRDSAVAGVRTLRGSARDDVERDLAVICRRRVDVAVLFSRGEPGFDNLGFNDAARLRRLMRLPAFTHYEIPLEGHTFATLRSQRTLIETLTSHIQRRHG
jgi:predicted alpha/beta hydrolase